ncbi:MAG: hypothetical protein PUB86_05275 [Elusimicrobia bacterium]|nr:hypothetical protein [Elusimicrobiota bacterium]
MNINVAAMGTGADVTRRAQILVQLVQAVNVGTAQSVRISRHQDYNITANVILNGQTAAVIKEQAGIARRLLQIFKMAVGALRQANNLLPILVYVVLK